ncbi:DUF4097 domain-containing protein [Bacillus sp. FJAT-42376]|uniref:DUF4097 family beta strand repeat-containing protein n=1 Tax=Bacillus sp. FJAT-42376 TaxID=2014076 RepID=UPI000F4E0470|nr:DUF4097 domain-containing protein [Bacillus sp. FJAT-42376]AZB44453.1 DUF4097 domain-containing protein [Bacillus sp. FJAT-42376]
MQEERRRILKLVEEGKLTVEEALSLIEKLDHEKESHEKKWASFSPSILLKKDEKEKQTTYSENQEETGAGKTASKLMNWIDFAVKKVKEMDLDLAIGTSYDVQHIFQFSGKGLKEWDVQIVNGNVTFTPWSEEDVRIECETKVYQTEDAVQAKEAFLKNFYSEMEGSKLRIQCEKKSMKANVRIYLPSKVYDSAKVKLFSGPIRGEQLTVKDFKAKTANGVISLTGLSGEKAELETANGQIKLAQHQFQTVEAETIHGMIDVRGAGKKLDLQSFNGKILLQTSDPECKTIHCSAATGSVEISIPQGIKASGELKSNLGSLHCYLDALEVTGEKHESIAKELKFRSNESAPGDLSVFADSKTSSVVLKHIER